MVINLFSRSVGLPEGYEICASMKFHDYYQTLGVERTASADAIQRSYRKLARKFHPDVNKDPAAEEKFKLINEAYEVLKDEEKRKMYDALGPNWKEGQDFRPPPEWGEQFGRAFQFDFGSGGSFQGGGFARGGFSDFFEALFGGSGLGEMFGEQHRAGTSSRMRSAAQPRAQSHHAELPLSIEDLYLRPTRTITLERVEQDEQGRALRSQKNLQVRIPEGTVDGSTIRLRGQGEQAHYGAAAGDLLLKVKLQPHPRYTLQGHDLIVKLPVTPWEAGLGAKVEVVLPDGVLMVNLPKGSSSGQRLRLRGKGLPKKDGTRGDAFAELQIVLPKEFSKEEGELMEKLAKLSRFNPRAM